MEVSLPLLVLHFTVFKAIAVRIREKSKQTFESPRIELGFATPRTSQLCYACSSKDDLPSVPSNTGTNYDHALFPLATPRPLESQKGRSAFEI